MLILEVGESGVGKTVSAGTFPKPAIMLDFDDGFTSVKYARDRQDKLIVPDHDKIEVVDFFKSEYHDLNFKTPDLKTDSKRAPEYSVNAIEILDKLNVVLRELYEKQTYNGKGPFKTVIIDSLTVLFRVWKEMILQVNNITQLRIQDYMTLDNLLYIQFIPSIKAIANKIPWVILVDHIQMDKDELTGRIVEFPVGPSANMGRQLGKEFDEVWLQEMENGVPYWNTRVEGRFQAKSRMHLTNPMKPASYKTIEEVLKKRNPK
jgi:hypothetical protein